MAVVKVQELPNWCNHGAVRVENCIIVVGGCAKSMHTIWIYNIYTEQWRKHEITDDEVVPPTTCGSCVVTIDEDVYVFGGWNGKSAR